MKLSFIKTSDIMRQVSIFFLETSSNISSCCVSPGEEVIASFLLNKKKKEREVVFRIAIAVWKDRGNYDDDIITGP